MTKLFDELWPGGPRYISGGGAFPLSTDSVLLADFAANVRAGKLIDLGCGGGILTVLLQRSHPGAAVCGIELQADAAAQCRENLELNGMDSGGILFGDLRCARTLYAAGSFDLAVSNPHYFPTGSGCTSPDAARAAARDERTCTLRELCEAAALLVRWGGAFCVVHRPERLSELCCTLTDCALELKRLRMVQHRPDSAPNLVLLEARRGGKPGLSILPPLILTEPDGSDSAEIRRIYHRETRT